MALAGFLEAHNGAIRTNASVKNILIENGKAVAVRLGNGEEIEVGKLVASNVDPQHLVLDLLGEDQVGQNLADKMRRYELGESVMVIYLALDSPIEYTAGPLAGESIYVHPTPRFLRLFFPSLL